MSWKQTPCHYHARPSSIASCADSSAGLLHPAVDESGKLLPVPVRVGQAVDVVAQAGRPKTITGAHRLASCCLAVCPVSRLVLHCLVLLRLGLPTLALCRLVDFGSSLFMCPPHQPKYAP